MNAPSANQNAAMSGPSQVPNMPPDRTPRG
jgi:hypothetical protein